jgi:hypothetical protein
MKRRWAVMATMLLAAVGTASAVESWIENGFEYPSGTNGYVGSDATTEGRWGNLQATDVYQYSISDNYAHSGSTALRIYRSEFDPTPAVVAGRTTRQPYAGSSAGNQRQFEVGFWFYRPASPNASIVMNFRTTTGATSNVGALYISSPAVLYVNLGTAESWVNTGISVPEDEWVHIRLLIDLDQGSYGYIYAMRNNVISNPGAFTASFLGEADGVVFKPSTDNGMSSYVDDFYFGSIRTEPVFLNTGFEYTPGSATYGDATANEGEWGPFEASANFTNTVVSSPVHSGSGALSAKRIAYEPDASLHMAGVTELFPRPGAHALGKKQFEMSFWVNHVDQFARWAWCQGSTEYAVGTVVLDDDDSVMLRASTSADTYTDFGVDLVDGAWTHLRFLYDLDAGTYGDVTLVCDETEYGPIALTAAFPDSPDRVRNYMSGNGTTTYYDDFYLGDIKVGEDEVLLNTGFEYTPGATNYGDAATSEGAWGPFGASANFVSTLTNTIVHAGNRSLRLYRAGYESNYLLWTAGRTVLFPRPGSHALAAKQFELSFWIHRSNQDVRLEWFQGECRPLVGDVWIDASDDVRVRRQRKHSRLYLVWRYTDRQSVELPAVHL